MLLGLEDDSGILCVSRLVEIELLVKGWVVWARLPAAFRGTILP